MNEVPLYPERSANSLRKPENILRILLLLPYLMLGIAIAILRIIPSSSDIAATQNALLATLDGIAMFYLVAVYFWGIPYSVLALGLLVWSLKMPFKTIYGVFFFSPFLLTILMMVELLVMGGFSFHLLEDWLNLLWYSLWAAIPTLIFGYIFVGMGIGAHKILESIGYIRQEADTTEQHFPSDEEL